MTDPIDRTDRSGVSLTLLPHRLAMPRQTVWLPLIAAAVMAACAAQQPASAPQSFLVVTNPQSSECELLLDTHSAAWVPAQTRMIVRWLPEAPFDLRWRCGTLQGSSRIQDSGAEVELSQERSSVDVVDRTASLKVHNPTPTDFLLSLDGEPLGNALAGDVSWFHDLPTGTHRLELRPQGVGTAQSLELNLAGQANQSVEIPPCHGQVRVFNSPLGNAQVKFRGAEATLEPGGDVTFEDVPAGEHTLVVQAQQATAPMTLGFALDCQQVKEVRLTAESATIVLENRLSEAVELLLPNREPISVQAGSSHEVPGFAPGEIRVQAKTASGRIFARDLSLAASATVTWVLDAPLGEVEISNLVGERIVILRGEVPLAELEPGASALLPITPGPVALSAWCPVTGHTQRLGFEVAKGERLPVRVGPQGGRIKLENTTSQPMWAYRNGRFLGVVPAKTTAEFGGQPLGKNLVELTTPDGQPLARRTVEAQNASPETQAVPLSKDLLDVTLHNMTGEPLKLDSSLVTSPSHLQPGVRMLVQVPLADPYVRAVGATTGLGYSARVPTQADANRDIVLTSQVGGVKVQNLTAGPVELWIDGKKNASLEAGKEAEIRELAPGRHVLAARRPDESAAIQQTAIVLAPNGWYQWKVQLTPKPVAVSNHAGEPVALAQDGQTAGRLDPGSQGSLPPTADVVRVQVQGETSGQSLRITLPAGSETSLIQVGPNLGVVAIWGLAGRSAVAELDGVATAIPADAQEPFRLAAAPGEKILVVRFDDGSLVERLIRVSPGMEVSARAQAQAVSLDVRNESKGAVELWVGESLLQTLEVGQSVLISVPTQPSQPALQARAVNGGRVWLMTGVSLPDYGKFAWILSE